MNIKVFELIQRKYEKEILSAYLENECGQKTEIHPFIYQPIELIYDEEGIEHTKITSLPYNMIRFSVNAEGNYTLYISFADNSKESEEFSAKGFVNNGYVKVSEGDKRYFEYTNGEPCFVMGINLAFPRRLPVTNNTEFGLSDNVAFMGMRQYERWLKKCSENGVNMARVWIGHEYFSPDTKDAKTLDYAQFSKLDILLDLARKYNIRLKLTFEQFRWFDFDETDNSNISRHFNKLLYLNGERCKTALHWIKEEKWKNAWLEKINEYAKRYAYDTSVFAFELWNEINCIGLGEGVEFSDIVEWNKEMIPKIKEMFPNHLVLNSLGSLDCDEALEAYKEFPWDLCKVKQMHRYLDQGAKYKDTTKNPIELIKSGMDRIYDEKMPFILAETGGCNNCHSGEFKYYSVDDMGLLFVDCVYTPVFLQSASCGNIWHWDERYIESKNLYKYFRPLADMLCGIDFCKENFNSIDLSDDNAYLLLMQGKSYTLGFVRNKSASWQNLLRDMQSATPCSDLCIDAPAGTLTEYPIWNEDTTEITMQNNSLMLKNVLYGTIFKIKH